MSLMIDQLMMQSTAYVSNKFALEGLSESMSYELKQFGIKIVLVEPGMIKTNFAFVTAKRALDANSSYSELMNKVRENLSSMMTYGTSPKEIANVILRAITEENPKHRYLVGNDAFTLIDVRKKNNDNDFEKIMVGNILR